MTANPTTAGERETAYGEQSFGAHLTSELRQQYPDDWLEESEIDADLLDRLHNNQIIGWNTGEGENRQWHVPRSQFAADGKLDARLEAWWHSWSASAQGRGQGVELFWAYYRSFDSISPAMDAICQKTLQMHRSNVYAYVTRLYFK